MSQHDQNIANSDGATVRADINAALAASFGNSSGASAPSTTIAYQFWADTTNGLMRQRNAANSAWITIGNLGKLYNGLTIKPQVRITLGVNDESLPVSTSDVTGATAILCYPWTGEWLPIWNSTLGIPIPRSVGGGLSLTLNSSEHLSGSLYDVFAYWDGSAVKLGTGPAWTNDTTRNETIGFLVYGFYINDTSISIYNGAGTVTIAAAEATLLGTFRASANGQATDSVIRRWLANAYNQVVRPMLVIDATDSWTYGTATFRQANASAANQLDFVQSVATHPVSAIATHAAVNSTSTARFIATGVGVDSTSVTSTGILSTGTCSDTRVGSVWARYQGYVSVGRHYLACDQHQFPVPPVMKVGVRVTPLGSWSGGVG